MIRARASAAIAAGLVAVACLCALPADARLVEVMKPWGRVWISVPEPAGDALPSPSARGLIFREGINACAARHSVDPALVEAIVACESAFDPDAVSGAGAMGLMQLMPETAQSLGVTDAFDVAQNLDGGTRHLAALLQSFDGNTRLAVAAYNAGETAGRRSGGIPPFPETVHYVRKVEHYLQALAGGVVMEGGASGHVAAQQVADAAAGGAMATMSPGEEIPEPEPPPARRGKSVTMGRDAQGRLVFINDPKKDKH